MSCCGPSLPPSGLPASAFGNPTGLIGMAPVNGVAATAERSDSRHAIDPAIAPVWTGPHTFNQRVTLESSAQHTPFWPSGPMGGATSNPVPGLGTAITTDIMSGTGDSILVWGAGVFTGPGPVGLQFQFVKNGVPTVLFDAGVDAYLGMFQFQALLVRGGTDLFVTGTLLGSFGIPLVTAPVQNSDTAGFFPLSVVSNFLELVTTGNASVFMVRFDYSRAS